MENVTDEAAKEPVRKFLGLKTKDIYQEIIKSLIVTGVISLLGFGWHWFDKLIIHRSEEVPVAFESETANRSESSLLLTNPLVYFAKLSIDRDKKINDARRKLQKCEDIFEYYLLLYDYKLLKDQLGVYDAGKSVGKKIMWFLLFMLTYGVVSFLSTGWMLVKLSGYKYKAVLIASLLFLSFLDVWVMHFAVAVFVWYMFKFVVFGLWVFMICYIVYVLILLLLWGVYTIVERFISWEIDWPFDVLQVVFSSHKIVLPLLTVVVSLCLLFRNYNLKVLEMPL